MRPIVNQWFNQKRNPRGNQKSQRANPASKRLTVLSVAFGGFEEIGRLKSRFLCKLAADLLKDSSRRNVSLDGWWDGGGEAPHCARYRPSTSGQRAASISFCLTLSLGSLCKHSRSFWNKNFRKPKSHSDFGLALSANIEPGRAGNSSFCCGRHAKIEKLLFSADRSRRARTGQTVNHLHKFRLICVHSL